MIVEYLPIESIKLDAKQPRKFFDEDSLLLLKESIRIKGIEMPLIVRECEEQDSIYVVLDGERRLRSATALNLREVPCIIDDPLVTHPKVSEISIVSKQLRLDFLKEKLTGEELDKAIFNLWSSLGELSSEILDSMGIKSNTTRDWRVPYIAREVGIGYTHITMSLNKEDFKQRNKQFHEKILKDIEDDSAKSKRYNRILGETSRHEGLRVDDDKRKTVIEEYINEAVSGDGKELRANLKKISEAKNPSEEDIREMFGLPTKKTEDLNSNKLDVGECGEDILELEKYFKEMVNKIFECQGHITGMKHVLKHFNIDYRIRLKASAYKILEVLNECDSQ